MLIENAIYQSGCVILHSSRVNESCAISLAILNQVSSKTFFSHAHVYIEVSFLGGGAGRRVECQFKSFGYFLNCVICFLIEFSMSTESIIYTSLSSDV